MGIVLASASPRRRELLEMLGVRDFKICPAVGEEKIEDGLRPDGIVCSLSKAKAEEVRAGRNNDDVIIAADTIVWCNGRVFGKPKTEEEAKLMLSELSGKSHEVYTGVTVIKGETIISEAECTKVYFRKLDEAEIEAYILSGEPMDKAGAYGIQGKASLFAEGIEGDFFNVMGLPLCRLGKMLKTIGVRLL